jgi:hypothetical protein
MDQQYVGRWSTVAGTWRLRDSHTVTCAYSEPDSHTSPKTLTRQATTAETDVRQGDAYGIA